MNEIELKFFNIDVKNIKKKLSIIGAQKKYDTFIESNLFVKEGFSTWDSNKQFLRIRKIDAQIIITHKDPAIKESNMTIRQETEVKVDDYKKAVALVEKLGFRRAMVYSKHRIHYEWDNIHFELDTFNHIPTYLEIETQTKENMKDICLRLDIDINQGKKGTIVEILPEKFSNFQ